MCSGKCFECQYSDCVVSDRTALLMQQREQGKEPKTNAENCNAWYQRNKEKKRAYQREYARKKRYEKKIQLHLNEQCDG